MKWVGALHARFVGGRRVRVLANRVAPLLPEGGTVLDVGSGDGMLALEIATLRPDLTVRGVDVMVRPHTPIPIDAFDGSHLPTADGSFDAVLIVDVLHHTDDPHVILAEAARVARQVVVIKDHLSDAMLAGVTLRFMDWVGNAPHGVRLPYNYWSRSRWNAAFAATGLTIAHWSEALGLYRWPASLAFERRLHFLAVLRPTTSEPAA